MINKRPPKSKKFYNGNFIPKNIMKVIKLNPEGGLYYRSLLELKTMTYLDLNPNIVKWGAEFMAIPYVLEERDDKGFLIKSKHEYYPDLYYKQKLDDGTYNEVFVEVKPIEQVKKPIIKSDMTTKQMNRLKEDIKVWNMNMSKWKYAIEWCNRKGFIFTIITEDYINKLMKILVAKNQFRQ